MSYPNTKIQTVVHANQDTFDHTLSLVTYNTIFYGVQLSEHFTSPNTPWSQRVWITDFLPYTHEIWSSSENNKIKESII